MIGKILKITTNIILVLLIGFGIIVAFSALPITEKYNIYSVQSGSMEPAIHTGSLIFTVKTENYQVGDVITRKTEDAKITVTHRIVEAKDDDGRLSYATKGDANENKDSEVFQEKDIIGEVFLKVPYLGYPVSFAKTTPGLILIIIIPAVIIIYDELQKIQKEIKKKIDYRKRVKKRKEEKQGIDAEKESNEKEGDNIEEK